MKKESSLKKTYADGLILLITPTGIFQARTPPAQKKVLSDGFQNPPASAKPHTWWHWMNGNVTKEGITLDLGAQQLGIVGFQNFDQEEKE